MRLVPIRVWPRSAPLPDHWINATRDCHSGATLSKGKRATRLAGRFRPIPRPQPGAIEVIAPSLRDAAAPGPAPLSSARPSRPLSGRIRVPGDKSISHRALMLGALAVGRNRSPACSKARTCSRPPPRSMRSAPSQGRRARQVDCRRRRRRRPRRAGGRARHGQFRHRGAAPDGRRRDPRLHRVLHRRRLAAAPADGARHDAAGGMGARIVARDGGRLPLAIIGAGRPAADHLSPAGALGAGEVGGAARRPQRARRDHRRWSRCRPATTASACCAISARRCRSRRPSGGGRRIRSRASPSSPPPISWCRAIPPRPLFPLWRRCSCPARRSRLTAWASTRCAPGSTTRSPRWAPTSPSPTSASRAASRSPISSSAPSALAGVEVPAERAPRMIDEYPILAVAAAFAARPHGDARARRAARQGKRPPRRDRRGARGLRRPRSRSRATRSSSRASAGRRRAAAPSRRGSTIASPWPSWCSALPPERPVRIDDGATIATSFPGFVALMNGLGAAHRRANGAVDHRDRRAGRLGQGHAGAPARRAFRPGPSRHRPALPRHRAAGARGAAIPHDPATAAAAARAGHRRRPRRSAACARSASARRPRWWRRSRRCGRRCLALQRDFARAPPPAATGAVLDGRDIGTVVCPERRGQALPHRHAEARAARRFKELQDGGLEGYIRGASCRI